MSTREFAKFLGISHTYVANIESGVDPRSKKPIAPTIDVLQKIAQGLNMQLVELLQVSGYIKSSENSNENVAIEEFLELVTTMDVKSIKIVQTLKRSGMSLSDINNAIKSLRRNS